MQSSALRLLFVAFQTLLRSLLLLDGVVEQLLSIVFAHLLLGLLLLLLVLILFVLLIVLLLILLFLIIFLVFVLLIVFASVLLLFFLKPLSEGKVIACLVVAGIIAQALFVGFDGLAIHPVLLADHTDVVISHCLAAR